jgi:Tfp pilus assembly protein PilX
MPTTRHSDQRGVSLLLTLLLILLLLVAVTGAAMRTSAERRSAMDLAAQVDAFALAQSGIDRYLEAHTTLPGSLPDSATYTVPGGRAVATLYRFRASGGDTLLVLVSRGENTTQDRYDASAATAVRTVAQFMRRSGGAYTPQGAFTSLTPIDKDDNTGTISGIDGCSTAPAPAPSIAGAAVVSKTNNNNPDWHGPQNLLAPNGANQLIAIGSPGTSGTGKDAVDIDWAGIVARTSITPNYYRKNTSPRSGAWPTSAQMNGTNWPIVFVEGNADLPNSGQGILIVTGNLHFDEDLTWKGLVLVGGTYDPGEQTEINGALVAGLNIKLGQNVGEQDIHDDWPVIRYNSCHLTSAMAQFGGWQRVKNGWMDNWPVY